MDNSNNCEEETHSSDSPALVTSSSPTPSSPAFQPYQQQQLHEAMLAAVNSHGISHESLLAAAAAAAAAAATVNRGANAHAHAHVPERHHEMEGSKRDSIRVANRERKKKWRLHNEERNKDNDLRCRVNKRAVKLFGAAESDSKQGWVNDEFNRRRQKRMDKERRKNFVDNALSVPQSSTTAESVSYYPTSQPPSSIDSAAAAKILDFPSDLQRQLLEQLNMALTNSKLPTPPVDFTQQLTSTAQVAVPNTVNHEPSAVTSGASSNPSSPPQSEMDGEVKPNTDEVQDKKKGKKTEYPMDAVLTLMQLNAGWRQ